MIMAYPVLFEVALPTSLIPYSHTLLLAHYAWLASYFLEMQQVCYSFRALALDVLSTWDNFGFFHPGLCLNATSSEKTSLSSFPRNSLFLISYFIFFHGTHHLMIFYTFIVSMFLLLILSTRT